MRFQEYKDKRIETVITIAVGFVFVFCFISWKYDQLIFWPLIFAGLILSLGLVFSSVGFFITLFWFSMTQVMGWISSRIILLLLYFFFITPYSLLFRLISKKDVLQRNAAETLFTKRNHKYESRDLENPW